MKKIFFFLFITSILQFTAGHESAVAQEEVEGNPVVHLYLVRNYELLRTVTGGFLEEYRAYGEDEDAYESITLTLLRDFMMDVVRDIDETTFAGELTAEDTTLKAYCHFMLGIVLDRFKNHYRAHFEYDYATKLRPFTRIETIDIGDESINFHNEIQRFNDRIRTSENLGKIKFKIRDFQSFSPLKPGVIILEKTSRNPVDPRIVEVVDDRVAMGDPEFETLIPYGVYTIDHKDKDIYIKDFYLVQGMDTVEVILAPNYWFSLTFDPAVPNVQIYSEGVRYWDKSYLRYGKYNIMVDSEEYFIRNDLNEFVLPASLSVELEDKKPNLAYDQHYPEVGQVYTIKLKEKGEFYKQKQEIRRREERERARSEAMERAQGGEGREVEPGRVQKSSRGKGGGGGFFSFLRKLWPF